jgi:hypothetical protein
MTNKFKIEMKYWNEKSKEYDGYMPSPSPQEMEEWIAQ